MNVFCKFSLLIAPFALAAVPSFGGTILFDFSANVDASQFGLSTSTPLTIQYSYDPSQGPLFGSSNGETYALNFTLQVGSNILNGQGEAVLLMSGPSDQFFVFAANSSPPTLVTGSINGTTVTSIDLNILNNTPPVDMLSSLNLPASTGFAGQANFVGVDINDFSNTHTIVQQFGPSGFTFTAENVPEPTTGLLVFAGCAMLWVVSRRGSVARAQSPSTSANKRIGLTVGA
jgi:hypothetical protein